MDEEIRARIESILTRGKDLTIATLRDDGYPQATTVSYVNDGLNLYFVCESTAQKARNIDKDNRVSLTVDLHYNDWGEIEGLSMAAVAQRVTDPDELARARTLLYRKYPQIADYEPLDLQTIAVIRVTPKIVSVLDYSKGFGYTELVELE